MSTPDEVVAMIADLTARQSKLSEWEVSFVDSIDTMLGRGGSLTRKQDETLTEIWERIT